MPLTMLIILGNSSEMAYGAKKKEVGIGKDRKGSATLLANGETSKTVVRGKNVSTRTLHRTGKENELAASGSPCY